MAHEIEDHVLWAHARSRTTRKRHAHPARLFLHDGLGRKNMRNFGRADAERNRSQRPMGRGMTVPAGDHQTRQGQTKLGSDHMHDPLFGIVHVKILHASCCGALAKLWREARTDLGRGSMAPRRCRDRMIRHGKGQVRRTHRQPPLFDLSQRLTTGEIVKEVSVDMQKLIPVA